MTASLYSRQRISKFLRFETNTNTRFESFTDTRNVFTGQYFDDFTLPALLASSPEQRVLLLGLGLGSAVRPLLATGRVAEIVGVDCEADIIAEAEELFSEHFPGLPLRNVHADALAFLESSTDTYDVIWVDLFDHHGYPALFDTPLFFERLAARMAPGGLVAVNAYTIPCFLGSFALASPERRIAEALRACCRQVGYVPYRRNLTVLASQRELAPGGECGLRYELIPADQWVLESNALRAREVIPLASDAETPPAQRVESQGSWRLFATIQQSLRTAYRAFEARWQERGWLEATGDNDNSLATLLRTEARAEELARRLLLEAPAELRHFPVLYGLLVNSTTQDFGWFIRFFLDEVLPLARVQHADLIHYCFPQCLSMARNVSEEFNPEQRYARYAPALIAAMRAEEASRCR